MTKKLKLFMYVGDIETKYHLPHFHQNMYITKQQNVENFYNYIKSVKDQKEVHFTGDESIANIMGHMVAEGIPIEPFVVLLKYNVDLSDLTSKIGHYDEEGFIANFPYGFFEVDNDNFINKKTW